MHLLGVFSSTFKLICCILFITKPLPEHLIKPTHHIWMMSYFVLWNRREDGKHTYTPSDVDVDDDYGEYYLCMWNKWIWGQKEGTEFAVNAKIISGVFWNNFTATRKTFATLVCETVWTNYTSDRWVGVDVDDDKLGGINFACETSGFGGRKEGTEFAPKQPTINHSQNFKTHNWGKYLSTAKMMMMAMQMLLMIMVF